MDSEPGLLAYHLSVVTSQGSQLASAKGTWSCGGHWRDRGWEHEINNCELKQDYLGRGRMWSPWQ